MLGHLKSGLVSFSSAFVASLCCLLPLIVAILGLGSGAFMIVTMQYRFILLPIGLIGVAAGYCFYFREKRRCTSVGCAFSGKKLNLTLLIVATMMLGAEVLLTAFPEATSAWLQRGM